MHNNAFVLYRYAKFLNSKIQQQRLTACVSTSSNDIHFLFSNGFYLLARFYKEHTFFLLPSTSHFPKKNVLNQFKTCINLSFSNVHSIPNDREIVLQMEDQAIHIQSFGRRSGILLVKDDLIVDRFKNLASDDTYVNSSRSVKFSNNCEEFLKENPFIPKELGAELLETKLFETDNPQQVWEKYEHQLEQRVLHLLKLKNGSYKLSYFPEDEVVSTYENVSEALHDFGKLFVAHDRHNELQKSTLQELNRDLKKQQKRKVLTVKHLHKISKENNFKEYADILMANLHQIESGVKSVELFDFYNNKNVVIPLKSNLSAQKNAERLYQKAKNSHLEVNHTKKQLISIDNTIKELENKIEEVNGSNTYKELLKFAKGSNKEKQQIEENKSLPYKSYTSNGFTILVGKSAKHNDALLKLMHRNDVWLHARGVAGSHVLIRNSEDKKVPETVLEFAASLAAKNSKNQHDTLAAVIYTSPKYVRKFKGALPGQVKVDREEVILVKPYSGD